MARSGWSTANYLSSTTAAATATPLTIAAWFNASTISVAQVMGALSQFASVSGDFFILQVNAGNKISAQASAAGTLGTALSTTTIAANIWTHACGVFASATSRAAFLNGGSKGTDATSITPSTINRTSAGVQFVNSAAVNKFNGQIADLAIWNAALDDFEVWLLAQGVRPGFIRPMNLVGWWEMGELNGPEFDLSGKWNPLLVTGTSPPHSNDDPPLMALEGLATDHAIKAAAVATPFGVFDFPPPVRRRWQPPDASVFAFALTNGRPMPMLDFPPPRPRLWRAPDASISSFAIQQAPTPFLDFPPPARRRWMPPEQTLPAWALLSGVPPFPMLDFPPPRRRRQGAPPSGDQIAPIPTPPGAAVTPWSGFINANMGRMMIRRG